MANEAWFLGVDGGGSHCRARLVDATGRRVGEGMSGGANIRLGLEHAWRSILAATDSALAEAGLDRGALDQIHAGLGLAGIMQADDRQRVISMAPGFAGIAVETDAHTACLGATEGADGAIVITGTGSVGYALLGGRAYSVGGWGFELSDAGSGADIGREAIKASLWAFDRLGPASELTKAVLNRLGGHPSRVIAWVEGASPKDHADFAPMVLDLASTGDVVATPIVTSAARAIGAMLRRLEALGAARISLMGGLGPAITAWLDPPLLSLLTPAKGDALDGAIIMARRMSGRS
jgi:glucosamine kinase